MGNKLGLFLMTMFADYGKARLLLCIHPWTGHTRNARTRDALFQGIDGSTTLHPDHRPDPHMMHSGLMAEDSSMIQRWNST